MKVAAKKAKAQRYMGDEACTELEVSLNQALRYEKGARQDYSVMRRAARAKAAITYIFIQDAPCTFL